MAHSESIQRLGRLSLFTLLAGAVGLGVVWGWLLERSEGGRAVFQPTVSLDVLQETAAVGDVVDAWRGVPVRANGWPYDRSHGRHVGPDGYYYGRMWQCVEFIKRFYYDHFGHAFPDGMGHAKSFFDPEVPHGGWNARRGLRQFVNGAGERPQLDDLVVWTQGTYGHVAVVSKVGGDYVEVVQQNVREGSRLRLHLAGEAEGYRMGGEHGPAGFLRRAAD
jgi:hypothetical protein